MPNPRMTSFECTYDLINTTAMNEAVFNSTSASSFSNINNLVNEPIHYSYITLEHNFSILDGELDEFPDTFTTPFMSSGISNLNGTFTTNPSIVITFPRPQNFYGLTFNFELEYPKEMIVEFYDETGKRLIITYNPDAKKYIASVEAINITSITITFTKTFSSRYIKLSGLTFGQTVVWGENEINSGSLVLDTDMISDMISINTLTFNVVDKNSSYNLANSTGLHNYLQKKQEIHAYEYINDNKLFLGKYFLNSFTWDNNLIKLNCVSYIGLLDDVQYNEGDIYNGTLAGVLLEDIFRVAGIEEYIIDTDTYNTRVYGTIKPGTCRDALREILFACNSTINTTTDDGITIYKTYDYILDTIYRRNKFSTQITKNDYVYGVELQYTTYRLASEVEEIVKEEEYLAGEHTIIFTNAYSNIVITANGSTITPSVVKKYYCTFTLAQDSTITISGKKYEEYKLVASAINNYIEAGESETIRTYQSTLCNVAMATEKAKIILNYLQFRLTLDVHALAFDINLDGRRWVENPNSQYANFITWYTNRNIDLVGGFIDTAKLVGYYYNEYDYYYGRDNTDNIEMYIDESVGII